MLQTGPPCLHYYCAVVLHSFILLTTVGNSSDRQYHCCQLTRQSSCVSNFYRTFKVFIWLSLVHNYGNTGLDFHIMTRKWRCWKWNKPHTASTMQCADTVFRSILCSLLIQHVKYRQVLGRFTKSELKRMFKEAVMLRFKSLSHNLFRGT
jgi:hypothetical protein